MHPALAMNSRNAGIAAPMQNLHRRAASLTANQKIKACAAHGEIAYNDLVEEGRQVRLDETNLLGRRVDLQAEGGFQQRQRRGARPGLRIARDGIERWPASRSTLEAAEQLRQAPQIHVAGGIEHAFEQLLDLGLMAIAGKTERDQGVVMRPDRPVVIRHRIVARLAPGDGPDAPSGEELRRQEHRGDLASAYVPSSADQKLSSNRAASRSACASSARACSPRPICAAQRASALLAA